MAFANKLEALDRVYKVYEAFHDSLGLACKEKCAHCCTTSVTMTTLEGYKIVVDLMAAGRQESLDKLVETGAKASFQPLLTTNRMAELCAADAKVPEEDTAGEWQDCALLDESLCSIYDLRPFGCRVFSPGKTVVKPAMRISMILQPR